MRTTLAIKLMAEAKHTASDVQLQILGRHAGGRIRPTKTLEFNLPQVIDPLESLAADEIEQLYV